MDKKDIKVLPREIQTDPLNEKPVHIDFLRVNDNSKINISVPIIFINDEKSPGLKSGGVLNVVRREIELSCLANNIPEKFVISLEGKEIGDDIRLSSVTLGEGMKPTILGRDFMLATIQAPKVEKEPEVQETEESSGEDSENTEEKKEEEKASE